jgi:hydroxymethylbilane synthase
MIAQVVAPDGEAMVQIDTEAPCNSDPIALGQSVADDLKSKGALDLLSVATAK